MANRKFQSKGQQTTNEFILVDLLPDVRRPRQFNVNILLIVLFAVILSWIFIYFPLSNRQETLNNVLEENNDLQYELLLVNEELTGYNIQMNRVNFLDTVNTVSMHQINYQTYYDELEALVNNYGGDVWFVRYSAVNSRFELMVELNTQIEFRSLNWDYGDLPYVDESSYTALQQTSNFTYTAIFTIEVNIDAE
ncbi:MAG: hypothetical protein ACOCUE_02395 [Candidatus Izemoplasmataceae bacterium]